MSVASRPDETAARNADGLQGEETVRDLDAQRASETLGDVERSGETSRLREGPREVDEAQAKVSRRFGKLRRRGIVLACVVVGLATAAAVALQFDWGAGHDTLVFYTVKRADLPITITERGTLESQENVQIHCEVDDVRGDGIDGIPIVWLIENGASVEKDDLLVELASASLQEQLDRQILDTERARAEDIQAEAKLENQITQNETALANAELDIKLAELELKMFTDPENGTHQLEVEEIKRLIEDINNEILAAQAELALKKNDLDNIDKLFKLGYAGRSDVDRERLEFLQAEGDYAAKLNKLTTQVATLEKKRTYEREMQFLQLQGSLDTAERNKVQVERNNEAMLDQAKAAADAAKRNLEKEEERLERYRDQVQKCKIYAPQEGMVVYATGGRRWWMDEIREGGTVRERQHILSLPNLRKMQVKTAVHESVMDQIEKDMLASIRVEAFPERSYQGRVKSVAVMAASQGSDTKVYETIVTIDGEVEQLKPDMTAVVDIQADRLTDVLSVPVQAIVQRDKETWCYVESGLSVQRRPVVLGRTNDEFVEVREGLYEGDRVVLNPMAIFKDPEQNGSEIAPDDAADGPESEASLPSPSDASAGE